MVNIHIIYVCYVNYIYIIIKALRNETEKRVQAYANATGN